MALQIEKTLYNGSVCRYHRVALYRLDPAALIATAELHSFRNQAHRALPVPPLAKEAFTFTWSGDGDTLGEEAYTYIKSLPEWSEAEDV